MGLFGKSQKSTGERTPVKVWGMGRANQNVVGESNYFSAIGALFPPGGSGEITIDVTLAHEPKNRYDSNAVAVVARTGTVGYLPREDAAIYAPIIAQLQSNSAYLVVSARIYGWMDSDWDTGKPVFKGSVSVDLPPPHLMFPINSEPERPYLLLPEGSAVQVTKEDEYAEALAPYLRKAGEAWVYATLHDVLDESGRTPKTVIQVRIDGRTVGVLTKASGEHYLPTINYLNGRGFTAAVRAVVKGNALKTDVVLHAPKAGELDMDWLERAVTSPTYDMTVMLDDGTAPVTRSETESETVAQPEANAEPEPSEQDEPLPPPSVLPPADWYPDPKAEKRLRYWDGSVWTEHVAD